MTILLKCRVECKNCGDEIKNRKSTAIFCSQVCRWRFNWEKKVYIKRKITCRKCGAGFFSDIRGRRYCSDECNPKNNKKLIRLIKSCVVCKKEFVTSYTSGKLCDDFKCKRKWKNRHDRPNGLSSKITKIPCEACGFSNLKAIHRHHINPLSGNAGGVMCLCANCHYIFHSVVGHSAKSESMRKESVLEVLKAENI